MIKEPLTNLQKEILKLYSTGMAEKDLSNKDMDMWLNEG